MMYDNTLNKNINSNELVRGLLFKILINFEENIFKDKDKEEIEYIFTKLIGRYTSIPSKEINIKNARKHLENTKEGKTTNILTEFNSNAPLNSYLDDKDINDDWYPDSGYIENMNSLEETFTFSTKFKTISPELEEQIKNKITTNKLLLEIENILKKNKNKVVIILKSNLLKRTQKEKSFVKKAIKKTIDMLGLTKVKLVTLKVEKHFTDLEHLGYDNFPLIIEFDGNGNQNNYPILRF